MNSVHRAPENSTFWRMVDALQRRIDLIPRIAIVFLGCGFARAWTSWILGLMRYGALSPDLTALQGHFFFDIGEAIGFFMLAFLARKTSALVRHPSIAVTAVSFAIFSSIVTIYASYNPVPEFLILIAVAVGGVAYSAMILLWLELYGCLSPQKMLLAWAGSYVLSFLTWGVISDFGEPFSSIVFSALPAISVLMLLFGTKRIPLDRRPSAPNSRQKVPWKIVASIALFMFAYGIADIFAGHGLFSFSSRLGMAIPEVFILIGLVFFSKRFDLRVLVTVLPLITAVGLIAAFFADGRNDVPFVLMSASNESYLVLGYALACATAFRSHRSAVFLAGIFAGVNKTFRQVGMYAGSMLNEWSHAESMVMTLGLVVVLAIAATTIVLQDKGIAEKLDTGNEDSNTKETEWLAFFVKKYGLTPKEATIFLMLSRGLASQEIAEELFLAPSTVRAHTSNMYAKMNVHSRSELRRLVEKDACEAGTMPSA